MREHGRRVGMTMALAGLLAAPGTGAWAQQSSLSLDAVVSGGYSTNPLLDVRDNSDSAFVELLLIPRYVISDERGTTAFDARYRRTEYLDRYGSTDDYGVGASASRRLSERLSASGEIRFDSFLIGQRGFDPFLGTVETPIGVDPATGAGTPPVAVLPPTPVALPIDVTQLGLVGVRERENRFSAVVAGSLQLSTLDSIQASANLARTTYGGQLDDLSFWNYGGSLGYSRAISPRTQVGVRGSVQQVDYDRESEASRIYSLQGTISTQLSSLWSLNAAAGLQHVERRSETSGGSSTGLGGNLAACRRGDRSNVCVRAFREAAATGFGDVTRVYGAGVDGSYRLGEDDVVRGFASYSNADSPRALGGLGATSYLNSGVSYEHVFTRRLTGGASLGYRDAYDASVGRPADLNVQLFLRTRIGDL